MTSERSDRRQAYTRTQRLAESLREVLAAEVKQLTDPRIGFVTITGVDVTIDLRHATVWYSVLTDDTAADTLAGLRSASPHLRRFIGTQVRMKYVPELTFKVDPAIAHGRSIEGILRTVEAEGALSPPRDDEEEQPE